MGKKVLVLGGDGFVGWAAALHLADSGNQVTIVDNFSRRKIDDELGVESLTPIQPMDIRLKAWQAVGGSEKAIDFVELDVAKDFEGLVKLVKDKLPDTIIHFAEQRAAPYSMKSTRERRYTVQNNVSATNNVLEAIVESGVDKHHLVHLGTMGVYGYDGGIQIPEGYVEAIFKGIDGKPVTRKILAPSKPGSVYHGTKVLDQAMFQLYASIFGVRITDLHQGIVWGTQTKQTQKDERLINRFDYDGDYGTVLNRFLTEAAIGYPLTVHGKGGQTRAFIHIRDAVRCVEIASQNPPQVGDLPTIYNQATEAHKLIDLANMISQMTGVEVKHVENPRKEKEENDLPFTHEHLVDLGLVPTKLAEGLLEEIKDIAQKYKDRINIEKIPARSLWIPKK